VSYILDALRKSEMQRQHGAAPTLQTTHIAPHANGRPAYWIYGVLATLLIGAGMAIGWLRPWQAVELAPIAEPVAATAPGPAQPGIAITPPLPAQSVLTPETSVPAAVRAKPHPSPSGAAAHVKKEMAVRSPDVRPTDAAGEARSAPEHKVLTMSELPPAIQQEIPPMTISVHAYSPHSADRMVDINDRLLREGGTVPPGLKLDEITPDGMIFSYKGYRFKRGLGAGESR
jgi:general secretion pathway protein B